MFNNELWQKPSGGAAGGGFYSYQIPNSCRVNWSTGVWPSLVVPHMSRAMSTPTNADKATISFWLKRSVEGLSGCTGFYNLATSNGYGQIGFQSDDTIRVLMAPNSGAAAQLDLRTTAVYRDYSAWYHLVLAYDSTQASAGDRAKLYINGEQVTSFTTETTPDLNQDFMWNVSGNKLFVGSGGDSAADPYAPMGGYLADYIMIDGTAQAVTDMGESKNGAWIPKDPSSLTFGSNGVHLKFESSADLGNDSSGNNNDFTPTGGIDAEDQMLDSPTFGSEGSANFPAWSPLIKGANNLSEGNVRFDGTGDAKGAITSWAIPTATKYYVEALIKIQTNYNWTFGIANPQFDLDANDEADATMNGMLFRANGASLWDTCSLTNGVRGSFGSDVGQTATRVLGMTVNRVDNEIKMYLDNSLIHTISISATEVYHIVTSHAGGAQAANHNNINAGQDSTGAGDFSAGTATDENGYGSFQYAPPTGFLALCSANLPTADAVDPAQTDDDYPQKLFSPTLYTGTDADINVPVGFQPDFVWMKRRDATYNFYLFDSTRGVTNHITSDGSGVQNSTAESLKAFLSTGFTYGDDATGNELAAQMVVWSWRANGGTTSAGSGDLTSTHQVDPSGGFSIVNAVGDGSGSGDKTVSHGLSAAPTVILAKNYSAAWNWDTYWAEGLSSGYSIRLNTTDNQLAGRWGTVDSSIFTCKYNYTWGGTDNFTYYCFTNIEGFIKAGTYVGNGDDNGTFVYTGFRPAWMLIREVAADNWLIYDDKRLGYNLDSAGNAVLYPDAAYAEENAASRAIDILSNGFKLRTSNATGNATAGNYIYLAMAKNPFQYATGR